MIVVAVAFGAWSGSAGAATVVVGPLQYPDTPTTSAPGKKKCKKKEKR